ncbi:hypothetical protein AWC05_23145 [Mycobacterium florentinum]|uniref:DUF302 domain-containing protein n=1 Tax=Mycobacterium florentinum TaxID=292462 RepID=A0A1X1U6D1_MYCFL|nr:DUF302 domain-containing protein [Mycobacterium florentinum]MCV7409960.1 DUF302 domain-containing protein [Mycobacterium florentinum]ORV52402.1 hypothetical protein AWC05_23145 [Mycobacterium florentinum]BBX79263.1 hypothetical protein MFLOJ_30500 [Mycobacterium florentinum]
MTSSVKTVEFSVVTHTMNRIDIATGVEFEAFIAAFEKAAPPVDRSVVQQIVARGGSWDDVLAAAETNAPNGLMVYAKIDALPFFSLAGHTTKAVEYLLGNHTIAETMYRHDPKALLYAPLRLLVHAGADGNAIFSMDQPGPAFGSLGIAEVTKVGESLDRKVANLLRVIGIDADQAFAQ